MKRTKVVLLVLSILLCSSFAIAITINVPGDQPTIQAGIDAATNGDVVLTQPGTYIENINYNGKNITVASLFYTTQDTSYVSQTIIDGNQNGSVITASSGESVQGALLCGLTLLNGSGTFSTHNGNYFYGGGAWIKDSGMTFSNVKIRNNSASGDGGAVCVYNGNFLVQNSEIFNNVASRNTGGINVKYGNLTVFDSEIYDNNSHGIACTNNVVLRISGCLLSNHSTNLLYNNSNDAIIENSVIRNGGTGIFSWDADMIIQNCTIVENNNSGLFIRVNSNSFLSNNIFFNNNTEITIDYFNNTSSTATIEYCDIEGGENGVSCAQGSSYSWLEGNINDDPLFVNAGYGDYHLMEYSPCIDAGDPTSPLDPDGTIADMGAFYYHQETESDDNEIQIIKYNLSNYPNPFNPSTLIKFSIQNDSKVVLIVYNIKGQKIKTLVHNEFTKGSHSITWYGDNELGNSISSGVYMYKLMVNGKTEAIKRCLLLK